MKHGQRGSTLIEMLGVLAITAIIAVPITMTIMAVMRNSQPPSIQHILLHQVHSAGIQMPQDIQMSKNVTISGSNGFPVTIDIPVDQDTDHDYQVVYLLDGDKLKRQQFDSSEILISETIIAQYVITDDTTFESPLENVYKLTITASLDEETITTIYEAQRRLTTEAES